MPRLTCTQAQLMEMFTSWCRDGGKPGTGQRFGQMVFNMYYHGPAWPELFYTEDTEAAFRMAFKACTDTP